MAWLLYRLFATLDSIIYSVATALFRIIFELAETPFFSNDQIKAVSDRVYIVVGVLMLFKLVISAVQYLINPDAFEDKEKGLGGILKKTAVSIGLIVIVPTVFQFLMAIQGPIIKTLPSVILGASPSETVNDEKIGFDLSFQVLSTFVRPKEGKGGSVSDSAGKISGEIHDINSFSAHVTDDCGRWIWNWDENCQYDYKYFISTISGAFLCYMLLGMTLDIAIRTIKMGIIQILAPIPISGYIVSKDMLNKFVKTATSVYLDLFIRMGIVYFVIFAILAICEAGVFGFGRVTGTDTGDWFRSIVVNIILVFGLLMFASKAPKFITDLLGLPDVGTGDLADMFKPAWQRAGGAAGALINPLANGVSNWRQSRRMGRSKGESLRRALGGIGKGALDSIEGAMAGDDWAKMRSRHENAVKRSGQRAARLANFEKDQQQTGSKIKRFEHFLKQMGVDRDKLKQYREEANNDYAATLNTLDNDMATLAHQINDPTTSQADRANYLKQYNELKAKKEFMTNNKDKWLTQEAYRRAATASVNDTLLGMQNVINNGQSRIAALHNELAAGVTDTRRIEIENELAKLNRDVTEATNSYNTIVADRDKEINERIDKIQKYTEGIEEVENIKISKHATTFNAIDTFFGGTGSRGKVYLDFADTLAKNRSNIYTGEAMTKMRQNADAIVDINGNAVTHTSRFTSQALLVKHPTAKTEYTYSEISTLLKNVEAGLIDEKKLQEEYAFENAAMVQSAFEDMEKAFAKDYINANVAAINGTVASNIRVRLKNPDKLLNSTITEWWDRFEDTILGAGLPPEEAKHYHEEFMKNPGQFMADASDLKEKIITRGTRYVDAENPKDGK